MLSAAELIQDLDTFSTQNLRPTVLVNTIVFFLNSEQRYRSFGFYANVSTEMAWVYILYEDNTNIYVQMLWVNVLDHSICVEASHGPLTVRMKVIWPCRLFTAAINTFQLTIRFSLVTLWRNVGPHRAI